ncbi:MAG: DNA cytosine methyltransferase [Candidatus Cloacimonetes bacterium]|nr:DNA cytosine methyltransferase [Candidatus Cloacimonadota bacterium]
MRVLVACEFSGVVREAFARLGHDAWSCDLLDTEIPGQHYKRDVKDVLNLGWDLMIAHPPCTHLAVSGARWFKEGIKPLSLQNDAANFFMMLINANIPMIAVENPICIMSTRYRKPDQIINPYQFGHPEQKKTCLWLKGLPLLTATNNVYDEMMLLPLKERTRIHWLGSNHWKERSRTFQGIADAMADQWGTL